MTIDDFLSRERHERELAWRAILRAERHLAIAEAAADLAALMTDYGVESLDALPLGEPSKGGRGKKLSPAGERLEKSLRSEFRLLYRGRAAIEPSGGVQ
jgi:hypothetical protein